MWRNRELPMTQTTRLFALLLALLSFLCAGKIALAEDDNWVNALQEKSTDSAADTGVLGLSAEERDSLINSQSDGEPDPEEPENFIRNRRRFVMREMKFNSDWDCDPTAVAAMVDQFKKRTGMDAQALQPRKPLTFDDPELLDWPYIYMTAHNSFAFSDAEIEGLKKFLDRGGFLHADDCLYGNNAFGPSFHGELRKVYPENELKTIDHEHAVFGTLLKQKFSWSKVNERGLPQVLGSNPFEVIDVGGHLRVLYTPPDIGCMWEISSPPTPSNPLGTGMHNMDTFPGMREAGYRMGVNFILYAMTH
jgi:hypothetical protein